MKHGGLLNIHFCKKRFQIFLMRQQKLPIFIFPIISRWKLLSCHSNKSSRTLTIKYITFVEGNILSMYAKFKLHPVILLMVSEKIVFIFFSKIYPLCHPCQPIKLSNLDKSRMKRGGQLNKHSCFFSNIPNGSAEIANFRFSHYKSMETLSCHSNQSSYPTVTKNITFHSPYL